MRNAHRPLPGHRLVVTATGPDEHGTDSVALWWTGPAGEPMAGWMFPARGAYEDPATASRLLVAAAGGLLVDRAGGAGAALLDRLTDRAGRQWPAATPRLVLDIDRIAADIGRSPAGQPAHRRTGCPVVDEVLRTSAWIGWCAQGHGPAALPLFWLRQLRASTSAPMRAPVLGLAGR